eukprot:gene7948-27298_t
MGCASSVPRNAAAVPGRREGAATVIRNTGHSGLVRWLVRLGISPSFADVYVDALVKDGFVSLVSICTLSLEDLETGETAVRIPKADRYRILMNKATCLDEPEPTERGRRESIAAAISSVLSFGGDDGEPDDDGYGADKNNVDDRTFGMTPHRYFRQAVLKHIAAKRITINQPRHHMSYLPEAKYQGLSKVVSRLASGGTLANIGSYDPDKAGGWIGADGQIFARQDAADGAKVLRAAEKAESERMQDQTAWDDAFESYTAEYVHFQRKEYGVGKAVGKAADAAATEPPNTRKESIAAAMVLALSAEGGAAVDQEETRVVLPDSVEVSFNQLADAKDELAKLSAQRKKAELHAEAAEAKLAAVRVAKRKRIRSAAAEFVGKVAANTEERKRIEAEGLEIAYAVAMSMKRMAAQVTDAEAKAAASVAEAAVEANAAAAAAVAASPASTAAADKSVAMLTLEVARGIAALRNDHSNPNHPTIYGNKLCGIHYPQIGPIVEEMPFVICFDVPTTATGLCYKWKGKFLQLDAPVPHKTDPTLHTYYQRITLGRDDKQMQLIFYDSVMSGGSTSYSGVFCFPTISTIDLLKANGVIGMNAKSVGSINPANALAEAISAGKEAARVPGRSKLREAAKQFTLAVQLGGAGLVWAQRAEVHLRAVMLKEAVRDASVAVAMQSDSAIGWTTLAAAQLQSLDYEACLKTCDRAIAAGIEMAALAQHCAGEKALSDAGASRWQKPDSRALTCPAIPEVVGNVTSLAVYLTEPFTATVDRYRALFRWVTHNIAYDVNGLRSGDYGDCSAEGVLKSRKGVCSGSARLFERLCHGVGLEAYFVSGYSKMPKLGKVIEKPSHAWNIIRSEDGALIPLDSCWGAGHTNETTFTQEYNEFWWCTPPERFVLTHLPTDPSPTDPKWSCLDETPSLATFQKTVGLKGGFFSAGLDLVSHKEAVIELKANEKLVVTFEQTAGPGLFLMAYLKSEGGQKVDCTCEFDGFERRHTVSIMVEDLADNDKSLEIFYSNEANGDFKRYFKHLIAYVVKKGAGGGGGSNSKYTRDKPKLLGPLTFNGEE